MGRRGPSRSLFAALPPDLRSTIRTNGYIQSQNGPDLDSLIAKQELISGLSDGGSGSTGPSGGPKLLRTQPASPSPARTISEDEEDTANGTNGESPTVQSGSVVAGIETSMQIDSAPVAGTSQTTRPIVKRRRVESVWEPPDDPYSWTRSQKRRKGKQVEVFNAYEGHPWDCTGLVERYRSWGDVPDDIKKYFGQRHLLFEEYDDLPLLLDHTGWFSVTAQPVARHIAERCRCDVIVDAFCGVGGNAIEFAKTCERVIAIDNDLTRLKLARHNALQYGVADRIEFIHGSYLDWARAYAGKADRQGIDVVFLSPPWGGVDYLTIAADPLPFPPTPASTPARPATKSHAYPLSAMPIPGDELFRISAALTPNIAYYLPRNVDLSEVAGLASKLDRPQPVSSSHGAGRAKYRKREWVELEEEKIGERVKAVTAYFGSLVAE